MQYFKGQKVSMPVHVYVLFSHYVTSDSVIPWAIVFQAPLSSAVSQSLLKFMSIERIHVYVYILKFVYV